MSLLLPVVAFTLDLDLDVSLLLPNSVAADIEAAQSTIDSGLAAMSTSQADLMQTMLS